MSVENEGKHIKNFTSEHIPRDLTWRQMLETGETIPSPVLKVILIEAQNDLLTTPGPNLERRKRLIPEWFNYWINLCDKEVSGQRKLFPFNQIAVELQRIGPVLSGLLMLAGGEGHRGHRQAALIMRSLVSRVIFAFEEPEYLQQHKERGEFLPLEVRLSMWNMSPDVHMLTVMPPKPPNLSENEQYETLYRASGAMMQFVEVRDPYMRLKQARRESGIELGRNVYVADDSSTNTTILVEKLMPDLDLENLLPESIYTSITTY